MWARSTRKFKGQPAFFFIFMAAILIVLVFGIAYLFGRFLIGGMESKLFIKMEINDEGRELASLLEAKKTESHYMEILGEFFINGGEHLESELEDIKNTIDSLGKDCILIYEEGETEPLKSIGRCPDESNPSASSESEIPIPGLFGDEVKGRVRIHEYTE